MTRSRWTPPTPEQRLARREAAIAAAAARKARERWYIEFTVRRQVDDLSFHPMDWRRYKARWAWPLLFLTQDAAWAYAGSSVAIFNLPLELGARRIVSYSVEKTMLPAEGA
jgi:hypothetical protein